MASKKSEFQRIGDEIGTLVQTKNKAYGDSFSTGAAAFRLLYPDGVKPEQYEDMLCLVRIWDKMMRVATSKDAFGEDPYRDITGYGILGAALRARLQPQPEAPANNGKQPDAKVKQTR